MDKSNYKISVSGLGYVGLPVLIAFSKLDEVIGFDINSQRIRDLSAGIDKNNEVNKEDLLNSNIKFSNNILDIKAANFHIVAVPTPVSKNNDPDLSPLISASEKIGTILKKGDIVVYESTVYPGVTEEICIPILEEKSSLKIGVDFKVGYSPERINPGDKKHRLPDIVKITSGSTPEIADLIDKLYGSIILAGTHKAQSIKVAEAAKVIENTQRDLNIALINELALIFNRLDIDTEEVLNAAETKWNFLPFKPGLVGGHCIGVDPYYLTHKAQSIGYDPKIILAGRALNDNMTNFVFQELEKTMKNKKILLSTSKILILGVTFKENCPDLRNSKVVDIIDKFHKTKATIDTFDPWVDQKLKNVNKHFQDIKYLDSNEYDVIIVAVAHDKFKSLDVEQLKILCKPTHIIYDLKYIFKKNEVEMRL